jgi:hypothetical protein
MIFDSIGRSQLRNDDEMFKLESSGDDLSAE